MSIAGAVAEDATSDGAQDNPAIVVEQLAACATPRLIGVRHHSPACAAAMPRLLESFAPTRVFVELPADLQSWVEWLGDSTLVAPVALAAARRDGSRLSFYPFADFSPELAAIRWARLHGVPVEAFDRPLGARGAEDDEPRASRASPLLSRWLGACEADDTESLWDRAVESRAVAADPEATRRAALMFGWALRFDATRGEGVGRRDLERERFMRARLATAPAGAVAVVGAFHAPALVGPVVEDAAVADPSEPHELVTSLVAYAFELLDSRSGYPAGIRDPRWQQRALETLSEGADTRSIVDGFATEIARAVRARGHVAGMPDAAEASRIARELAGLRDLPGPGRRELLEGIEAAMVQGERLGRGRVVAKALEEVLVGDRRGQLPAGAPRSGLGQRVRELVQELALPGPPGASEPRTIDLDSLRSSLDRRRTIALERMRICEIVYGTYTARGDALTSTLTSRWSLRWSPTTEATLEAAGLLGVTLEQAATGALLRRERLAQRDDRWQLSDRLGALEAAATCGLSALTTRWLREFATDVQREGGLAEVVATLSLVEKIRSGQVPGLAVSPEDATESAFVVPAKASRDALIAAAVRAVEGLAGSTRIEDARALGALTQLAELRSEDGGASTSTPVVEGRLGWSLRAIAREGAPLMRGAAGAACVLLRLDAAEPFGVWLASMIDLATTTDASRALAAALSGAVSLAEPLFSGHAGVVTPLLDRIAALDDDAFLHRVAPLRHGFSHLSPLARQRLLDEVVALTGLEARSLDHALSLTTSADDLARNARADAAGRRALEDAGLALAPDAPPVANAAAKPEAPARIVLHEGAAIGLVDRLRLVFGRERSKLGAQGMRAARALDELYGRGRGESGDFLDGGGAGLDGAFPTVREWKGELEALFGATTCEQILGRAAESGRAAAAFALDPDAVTPSVALLEQVLSLKGGLAGRDLDRLRLLVKRIVDPLVEALSTRIRPALTGLSTPRPTSRPTGALDLRRTIQRNLRTARPQGDGFALVAERLVFRTRAKKSMDWHLVLVVDVSGSMEASVIYSAMMAAILHAVPALTVQFVAFNTEVINLSERVDDPLGLLLEISVGGGTRIGHALRYARGLLKVPARSIVVLVSDFEEGESVGALVAETRALVETGATVLGLAALDDSGAARFSRAIAELLAGAGMKVGAMSPMELARWVGEQIR